MRIVLAAAPTPGERHRQAENLGLRYLVSVARKAGHVVTIIEATDRDIELGEFVAEVCAEKPDVIGFGIQFANQAKPTCTAADLVQSIDPGLPIVVGGQALNFAWEDALSMSTAIDAAVCFEGETTFLDYLDWIAAKHRGDPPNGMYVRDGQNIVFTGYRDPMLALDDLPFPDRDEQSRVYGDPNFVVLTSRGCQSGCTFCSSGFFGNRYHNMDRWRARSAENVVDELSALSTNHNAKAISFVDDDFLGGNAADDRGRKRAIEIASLINSEALDIRFSIELRADETLAGPDAIDALQGSGLAHVLIGIDGLTAKDLKLYAKRVKLDAVKTAVADISRRQLSASYGVIMFNPTTSLLNLEEAIANLADLGIAKSSHITNRLQIYRGSPILAHLTNLGHRIEWEADEFRYDYGLDADVDLVWHSFRELASDFKQLEIEIARAKFRISTGLGSTTQRSHSSTPDETAVHRIAAAEQELSAALCDEALTCVQHGEMLRPSRTADRIESIRSSISGLVPLTT